MALVVPPPPKHPSRKPWLVYAVDPGREGAIALLGSNGFADGRVIDTKEPDQIVEAVDELLESAIGFSNGEPPPVCRVYIEDVHSMPGEGHVGAFSFGRAKGVPVGWFEARGHRHTLIDPKAWQAHFFGTTLVGVSKEGRKEVIRLAAQKRWPAASLSRKMDEAVAAALYIGTCGVLRKPW